ncbi:hypothetical protein FRB94_013867 [Tulasnella sp. JGI-2019a]|nr:hypothetical protein FRB93_008475 [Tulasnella sp. JGI-2019a]KAG9007920.1 hypothetical protein FRB94_013867 [Tulasnella sp. JGI-2019a]
MIWFDELGPSTHLTWSQLRKAFLKRFYYRQNPVPEPLGAPAHANAHVHANANAHTIASPPLLQSLPSLPPLPISFTSRFNGTDFKHAEKALVIGDAGL